MLRITPDRHPKIQIAAFFFFFCYSLANGGALTDNECGTVITPEVFEFESQRLLQTFEEEIDDSSVYYLPVTLHIVRRSDGTGGIDTSWAVQAMRDLNEHFTRVGMSFFRLKTPAGFPVILYIDSDFFYDNTNTQEMFDLLRTTNRVQNTINVWFAPNTGLCGSSTFSSSIVQGIIIDSECAGIPSNPSTISHEFGHYFDLFHTHESRFGIECPDSSNCESAGDLICDTPADPNLNGFVLASCVYDGTTMPPAPCLGSYNPQTSNVMSHSLKYCRDLFTPGQVARMRMTLINERQNIMTTDSTDSDADGVPDMADNCPDNFNPDQISTFLDGIGDACVFAHINFDKTIGALPLTVNFIGESGLNVLDWLWEFGDGSESNEQSPTYTYITPGQFEVSLIVATQDSTYVDSIDGPIIVVADTLFGSSVNVSRLVFPEKDGKAQIDIYVRNNLPVRQFQIPFSWAGPFTVDFTGWSTDLLRISFFESQSIVNIDFFNQRAAINLTSSSNGGFQALAPGKGLILKLFFDVTDLTDDSHQITIGPIFGSDYYFATDFGSYPPLTVHGQILLPSFICGDANGSGRINIADVSFLIARIFAGGPPPIPTDAGDANGSGEVNIADVTYLIALIFAGGPAPVCP